MSKHWTVAFWVAALVVFGLSLLFPNWPPFAYITTVVRHPHYYVPDVTF